PVRDLERSRGWRCGQKLLQSLLEFVDDREPVRLNDVPKALLARQFLGSLFGSQRTEDNREKIGEFLRLIVGELRLSVESRLPWRCHRRSFDGLRRQRHVRAPSLDGASD